MPDCNPSAASGQVPSARTPEARLRRIEEVLADPGLTPAEARAVVGVVLHGNGDGLAWPGQRRLRLRFHVGGAAINSALKVGEPPGKALGVHLIAAGLGPDGVQKYRVLAVSGAPTAGAPIGPPVRPSAPAGAPADACGAPTRPRRCAQREARNQQSKPTDEPKEGKDGDNLHLPDEQGRTANGERQQGQADDLLVALAAKARLGGGKWPAARWAGQIEEDLRARRFTRSELEAYVREATAVTVAPWKLAEDVRLHAEAVRAAAFQERLRRIRAAGLTAATGPDSPGRVVYVEPERPLLVIERRIPPPPGTSYGPQVRRWDLTTPEALAPWTFRPEQPVLFDAVRGG